MSLISQRLSLVELRQLTVDINERRITASAAEAKLEGHKLMMRRDSEGTKPGVRIYCRQNQHKWCKARHCSCPCHKKGVS